MISEQAKANLRDVVKSWTIGAIEDQTGAMALSEAIDSAYGGDEISEKEYAQAETYLRNEYQDVLAAVEAYFVDTAPDVI